jgi:hypothetical protein
LIVFLIIGVLVVALGVVGFIVIFATAGDYDGNGVAFHYPKTWVETDETVTQAEVGNQLWSTGVGPVPEDDGEDDLTANVVIVTGYRLNTAVTDANVDQVEPELIGVLDQLTSQAGSSWPGTLERRTIAGKPAFVADGVGAVGPQQQQVESRVAFIFDDTTQYFVNCQYEPPQQSSILGGCDEILDTFEITGEITG